MLSDALWRSRFGADPNVLGRQIRLNDYVSTIVGVMPPSFRQAASAMAQCLADTDHVNIGAAIVDSMLDVAS